MIDSYTFSFICSGTFQHVEYVFLVGVGGGVPHYTDYEQHVRLGDVVVSSPPFDTTKRSYSKSNVDDTDNNNRNNKFGTLRSTGSIISSSGASEKEYVYVHCEKRQSSPDEPLNASNSIYQKIQTVDSFEYHSWCPISMTLQNIAHHLLSDADETGIRPWETFMEEAREQLEISDDLEFHRPDLTTDKLYMSIGTNDLIEMVHPQRLEDGQVKSSQSMYDPRAVGYPQIHFGAIGSGRIVIGNEQLRQDIAHKFGIKAFDIEFDTVIQSILGNRKECFMILRGIADYKDGTRKKEWQPYAALSAAAFMKAVLCRLDPMTSNDSI